MSAIDLDKLDPNDANAREIVYRYDPSLSEWAADDVTNSAVGAVRAALASPEVRALVAIAKQALDFDVAECARYKAAQAGIVNEDSMVAGFTADNALSNLRALVRDCLLPAAGDERSAT